jgi:Skp family chaperone for outer membrane proteins
MLLARGLRQQGQAVRQNLQKELVNRAEKIQALEQELEVAKKQAKEDENARKTSKAQIKKMLRTSMSSVGRKATSAGKSSQMLRRWRMSTRI